MLTFVKEHFKLTVGVTIGVVVLIALIIISMVYLLSNKQAAEDGGQAAEEGLGGKVAKEEDEGIPVLPITLSVFAVVLIVAGLIWKFCPRHKVVELDDSDSSFPKTLAAAGTNPRKLFTRLQKLRDNLPPELRCVIHEGKEMAEGKPLKVLIKNSVYANEAVSIDCPVGFTSNSVWWAFQDANKKVDKLALANLDYFSLAKPGDDVLHIWLQNYPPSNIPGNDDVPTEPLPLEDEAEGKKAFLAEYAAWHIWAIKDENCKLETEATDFSESVSIELSDLGVAGPVKLKCQSRNPTFRSVYSALVRVEGLKGKLLSIYSDHENAYSAHELAVSKTNRRLLWLLYEPFHPLHNFM